MKSILFLILSLFITTTVIAKPILVKPPTLVIYTNPTDNTTTVRQVVPGKIAEFKSATNPNLKVKPTFKELCKGGYSKTVRPTTAYTNKLKRELIKYINVLEVKNNLPITKKSDYELDHKTAISVLGDPTSTDNLWMELWVDAKKKDILEGDVHRDMCNKKITIEQAQQQLMNWQEE